MNNKNYLVAAISVFIEFKGVFYQAQKENKKNISENELKNLVLASSFMIRTDLRNRKFIADEIYNLKEAIQEMCADGKALTYAEYEKLEKEYINPINELIEKNILQSL